MPKVYIIPEEAPNAFATGRNPEHAAVAVTQGILRILDRDDWAEARSLAAGIDLCLLAVPIDATPAVARQIGPHLPAGCILADITSLKRAPLEAMLESHAGPVIGLHPLFGPATVTMGAPVWPESSYCLSRAIAS